MPDPLALLHIVKPLTPVVGEHVQHDVFGHAHGQIGIDDAHDGHIGQIGIGKNMIDAGAEREDHFEMRQAGEQRARGVPCAGIGDVGGVVVRPQADVALRRERAQAIRPRLRIGAGDGEQDRGH